jgi:tRNA(Ile2) C34 agmatinyltransferase TiaS
MTTTAQTTTIRTGHKVLASTDRHGRFGAVSYTNHTQANRRAARLQAEGRTCWVLDRGACKFIVVEG